MILTLDLNPELENCLNQEATSQGIPVDRYALSLLEQVLSVKSQSQALDTLLQSWIDEDDQTDQETGDFLIQMLDEDRLSDRKLFPADLKGITW